MKKLKIENLRLQSFITNLDKNSAIAKGGARLEEGSPIERCSALDACPSALQCTGGFA